MSEFDFKSVEECLEKYIPQNELKEVKRVLFGREDEYVNCALLFKKYMYLYI